VTLHTFFIIGAQRCGTTSLAQVLSRSPDVGILGTAPPESRLFLRHADPHAALAELHSHAGAQVRWMGCKSTTYLERMIAAERIQRVVPQAQVIVMLRDPIARAISNYHYTRLNGLEHLPIDEALDLDAQQRSWDTGGISTNPFAYLDRGRYAEFLEPWLALFPDMMVFILEELLSGTDSLQRLGDTMGIEIDDFSLAWTHENQGDLAAERPSDTTITRLRDYYAGPNERLAAVLGRPITAWA